jgi:hypothetical protein
VTEETEVVEVPENLTPEELLTMSEQQVAVETPELASRPASTSVQAKIAETQTALRRAMTSNNAAEIRRLRGLLRLLTSGPREVQDILAPSPTAPQPPSNSAVLAAQLAQTTREAQAARTTAESQTANLNALGRSMMRGSAQLNELEVRPDFLNSQRLSREDYETELGRLSDIAVKRAFEGTLTDEQEKKFREELKKLREVYYRSES